MECISGGMLKGGLHPFRLYCDLSYRGWIGHHNDSSLKLIFRYWTPHDTLLTIPSVRVRSAMNVAI